MMMDDNDGQMIFRDLGGLKLPDICLTGEEKPRKNLTQETCPDRGSNPCPLRDKRACYHLLHSGGLTFIGIVGAKGDWDFRISDVVKNPEKASPRKLVLTGDRIRARCVTGAHATTWPTAVDYMIIFNKNFIHGFKN